MPGKLLCGAKHRQPRTGFGTEFLSSYGCSCCCLFSYANAIVLDVVYYKNWPTFEKKLCWGFIYCLFCYVIQACKYLYWHSWRRMTSSVQVRWTQESRDDLDQLCYWKCSCSEILTHCTWTQVFFGLIFFSTSKYFRLSHDLGKCLKMVLQNSSGVFLGIVCLISACCV